MRANWLLYHHRTSVLTKNIHIYARDINKVVSEFTRCILQAEREAIPKGDRKEYKPYWNNDLENLHNELNTTRDVAEYVPTSENNTALKQVNAKFTGARGEAGRKTGYLRLRIWMWRKMEGGYGVLQDNSMVRAQDHTYTRRYFNTWENSS